MKIESGNGFSFMTGNLAADINYLPHEDLVGDHKQPDDIELDGDPLIDLQQNFALFRSIYAFSEMQHRCLDVSVYLYR